MIRGPAGDGRFAPVARDDIADVAVAVLLGEGHERATYDVTGDVLKTMAEWAAELAPTYSPELNLVGAAIGGIPVHLAHNTRYINGT